MTCDIFLLGELKNYKYVVVLSRYRGEILLSRHRLRNTWETQGGHIEPGETPLQAARRELFEESGASDFDIRALCDYSAADSESQANGMVFFADIHALGPIPESEMECTRSFSVLPAELTYPDITPKLFEFAKSLF